MNFQAILNGLMSPQNSDMLRAVNDIKERIDFVHTPEFFGFTNLIFPALRDIILSKISPQMEDNDENKIRHTVLEICSRFPTTETLRSIVMDLINIGLRVIQDDNEDNAVIALKIMFDLHKTYRPSLESQVQPLVEIMLTIFKNMPLSLRSLVSDNMNQVFPNLPLPPNFLFNSNVPGAMGSTLPNFGGMQGQQQFMLPGGQGVSSTMPPLNLGMFPNTMNPLDSHQLGTMLPPSLQNMPMNLPPSGFVPGMTFPQGMMLGMGSNPQPTTPMDISPPASDMKIQSVDSHSANSSATAESKTAHETVIKSESGHESSGSDSRGPKQSSVMPHTSSAGQQSASSASSSSGQIQSSASVGRLGGQLGTGLPSMPFNANVDQFDPKFGYLQNPAPFMQNQQPLMLPSPLSGDSSENLLYANAQQNLGQLSNTNPNMLLNSQPQLFPSHLYQSLGSMNSLSNQATGQLPPNFMSMPLLSMPLPLPMLGSLPGQTNMSPRPNLLVPAMHSVKVLGECPQVLMFLFQIYFKTLQKTLPTLMEHVMAFVEFSGTSYNVNLASNRTLFKDLIFSQVKSLSFVSFVYRLAPEVLAPYENKIVSCVRALLNRCPDDTIITRKDLIHATKALMTSELKRHFMAFMDEILDEKFFLGPTKQNVLRTYAMTAVIDFIHQVKELLETRHVVRIVQIFCMYMNDTTLDIIMQTSCCKLLYTMIDSIATFQLEQMDSGHYLLQLITRTVSNRIEALYAFSISAGGVCESVCRPSHGDVVLTDSAKLLAPLLPPPGDSVLGEDTSLSSVDLGDISRSNADNFFATCSPKEIKLFCRSLFWGIKGLVTSLHNMKAHKSRLVQQSGQPSAGLDSFDLNVFGKVQGKFLVAQMIIQGLHICSFFLPQSTGTGTGEGSQDSAQADDSASVSSNVNAEVQDVLEYLYSIMCALNTIHLREVFDSILPTLYQKCKEHGIFLNLLQQMINNPSISSPVLDVLVCFLLSKLQDLSLSMASTDTNVLLRAFKIVMSSLVKLPENERVLRPKLMVLITSCFRLAHEESNPKNYFFLLRMIFRAVTQGKFEQSYKHCAPFIPMLLHGFTRLIQQSKNQSLQALLLELTLTVPARFNTLVPHIPFLFTHISWALKAKGEVASIGLRTLEVWIDHLGPDSIANMLHQDPAVAHAVIAGICDHLRLHPHPYGSTAIKLLGKLGCHSEGFIRGYTPNSTLENRGGKSLSNRLGILLPREYFNNQIGEDDNNVVDVSDIARGACDILQLIKMTVHPCSLNDTSVHSSTVAKPASMAEELLKCTWTPLSDGEFSSRNEQFKQREKDTQLVLEHLLTVPMIENNTANLVGLDSSMQSQEINFIVKSSTVHQKLCALNVVMDAFTTLLSVHCSSNSIVDAQRSKFLSETVKEAKSRDAFTELLSSVVVATIDNSLRDKAQEYLRGVCKVVINFAMNHSTQTLHLGVDAMLTVVCKLSSDFRPKIVQSSLWLLQELVSIADETAANPFKKSLVEALFSCCTQHNSIGSIRIITFMVTKFASNIIQDSINLELVNCILNAVQFCDNGGVEISNETQSEVANACTTVIDKVYSFVPSIFQGSPLQQSITQHLIRNCFHICRARRSVSEYALQCIASKCGMTFREMLNSLSQLVQNITVEIFGAIDGSHHIGILHGVTLMLSNALPMSPKLSGIAIQALTECYVTATAEPLAPDNMMFDMEANPGLPRSSQISTACFSKNTFPLRATESVERRQIFVRLFSSFWDGDATASLNRMQLDSDNGLSVVCKCIILCFNILLVPSDHGVHQLTLAVVMKMLTFCVASTVASSNKTENKYLQSIVSQIKSCCREYCGRVHDIKACSKAYLSGIAVILEYLPSGEHVLMCNSLMDHLKRIPNVDQLMVSNYWTPGQELIVGSSLLELLQFFPLQSLQPYRPHSVELIADRNVASDENVTQCFADAVNSYIQIDASRFRYRQIASCCFNLEEPILQFVVRYQLECARFLWHPQSISRFEVCSLIVNLFNSNSPLANEVLGVLGGAGCLNFVASNISVLVDAFRLVPESNVRERNMSPHALEEIWSGSSSPESSTGQASTAAILESNLRLIDTTVNYLSVIEALLCKLPSSRIVPATSTLFKSLRRLWHLCVMISSARAKHILTSSTPLYGLNGLAKLMRLLSRVWARVDLEPSSIEMLFELTAIFKIRESFEDLTHLSLHVRRTAMTLPMDLKKDILSHFLMNLYAVSIPAETKVVTLQHIVFPLVAQCYKSNTSDGLFDESIVKQFVQEIFINSANDVAKVDSETGGAKMGSISDANPGADRIDEPASGESFGSIPSSGVSSGTSVLNDTLRVELMKMCNMVVEHSSSKFKSFKRELVKFAWNHVKSEDTMLQNWATVNLCRFFATFDCPTKIILQTYVMLLKGPVPETRDIIRTALDIAVPCLQLRMPAEEFTRAMKWTKKLLTEEVHSHPSLVHILHVIVRHPSVYFSYRFQLIPQIITCMSRVGLPQNAALENRIVALNIADLLVNWEWCRLKRKQFIAGETGSEVDGSGSKRLASVAVMTSSPLPNAKLMKTSEGAGGDDSTSNRLASTSALPTAGLATVVDDKDNISTLTNMQLVLVANFIIRLGSLACESKESGFVKLSSRCSALFKKMVSIFPFQNIKLNHFEKLLMGITEYYMPPKKDTSNRDVSTPALVPKNPNLSEASLIFCLEILLATLECLDGPCSFLLQNVSVVLGLCAWAFTSKSFAVHAVLRSLITKVIKLYPVQCPPPPFIECGFYSKLREMLDKNLKLESSESNQANQQQPQSQQQNIADRHYLFLALLCIDDIIKIYPEWVNYHAHTVVKVCTSLLTDHIARATKSSLRATDINYFPSHSIDVGQDFSIFSAQPLSSTALFADYISNDGVHSSHSSGTGSNNSNSVNSLIHTRLTSISQNCSTCGLGITLLCKSLHRGLMASHRQAIISLIVSVLEGSDNPHFLFIASQVCNAWIARPRSPLTASEQWFLYSHVLSSFDRFPDYSAHPYLVRLACISERVGRWFETDKSQFMQVFGSSLKHQPCSTLGLLGVSSVVPEIQLQCLKRLSKLLGNDFESLMENFFKADWSALNMRFIPVILPSLILLNPLFPRLSLVDSVGYWPGEGRGELMDIDNSDKVDHVRMVLQQSCTCSQNHSNKIEPDLCVVSLLHGHSSERFWQKVLQSYWSKATIGKRSQFCSSLESFLLSNRFKKFCYSPPDTPGVPAAKNTPQWFMDSMMHLEPLPIFSCPFLQAMHTYYGVGASIGPYLERLCSAGGSVGNFKLSTAAVLLTADVYKSLRERSMLISLYRMFSSHELTDAMLGLEQYERYFESHQNLSECINRHCKAIKESSAITSSSGSSVGYLYYNREKENSMTLFDLEVWEERWVTTAQNLSKWGILLDVSQQQHMPELALECAAIKCDWDALKKLRVHPTNVANLENGLLNTKLIDVMISVVDNRFGDVEKLCAQSVQLALSHWQKAPPLCTGSNLHKSAFNAFHRVVELRESNVVMIEAFRASKDKEKNIPDIKNTLKSWRLRLCETPFFTQSIDSLMEWRLYIFNAVKNIYQNTPNRDPNLASTLVDTTWTLLSNARCYRKQRLPEVSLLSFHRLRVITAMEVSDIFTKIREQVMLSFSPSKSHMLAGLHLINTTNLDFFDSYQKAELFRLKALLLYNLDKAPEANEMFAHSVQVHRQHNRAWLCWANYCYDMIALSFQQPQQQQQYVPDVSQVARTIVCVMKAVEHNSAHAKHLLPRVLWAIVNIDNEAQLLADTMWQHGNFLAASVWVHVLRRLLDAVEQLCNANKRAVAEKYLVPILAKIVVAFPNAIVMELLSRMNSVGSPSTSPQQSMFQQLFRQLKSGGGLSALMVADLAQNFNLTLNNCLGFSVIEEALDHLDSLWTTLLDISDSSRRPEQQLSQKLAHLSTQLQELLHKCQQTGQTAINLQAEVVHRCLVALNEVQETKPLGPDKVIEFLQSWSTTLEDAYVLAIDRNQHLLNGLCVACGRVGLEMPGQYQVRGFELHPDRHNKLVAVRLAPVSVDEWGIQVSRGKHRGARLEFLDEDGRVTVFKTRRGSNTNHVRRQQDLIRAMDWILLHNCSALKRDLFMERPSDIPISNNMVLVSETAQSRSLEELQANYLVTLGSQTWRWRDVLVEAKSLYEEKLQQLKSLQSSSSQLLDAELRKQAMKTVLTHFSKLVPGTMLRSWLWSANGCGSSYFVASRTLASQLGVHSALQLLIGCAPPEADDFSVNQNGLVSLSLAPALSVVAEQNLFLSLLEAGQVDSVVQAWYAARQQSSGIIRCTRLVQLAISPSMLLGMTAPSIGACFDAMAEHKYIVEGHLIQIFSEELLELVANSGRSFDETQMKQLRVVAGIAAQKLASMVLKDIIKMNPFKPDPSDTTAPDPKTAQSASATDAMKLKPVDKYMSNILGQSTDETNLLAMPLQFMSWL